MATSSRNAHIIKKCPHHQKMATSLKRLFFDEVAFFNEFVFAGTLIMSFHVELDEVPHF